MMKDLTSYCFFAFATLITESMFTYRPIFHYQLLSLLLFTSSAAVLCFDTDPNTVPRLADCRHILSRLPSIPALGNNAPSDAHTNTKVLDTSSPFSPNAIFLYRSCYILFNVGQIPKGIPITMRETDTMEVWTLMQQEAARIAEQCIVAHRTGLAKSKIEARGFYYTVQIFHQDAAITLRHQRQRWAMEHSGQQAIGRDRHYFWKPTYFL